MTRARQTGQVTTQELGVPERTRIRRAVAEQVFVTRDDLYPMLVLLIATTGWNLEVIKELPVEHRVIEGRAVEVDLLKRRRGAGNWHQTTTWDIGANSRELHTPGGLYLLLNRLMAPAREFLEVPSFWAVWHHFGRPQDRECRSPFATSLNASLKWSRWTERHDLRADSHSDREQVSQDERGAPLRLTANRLKTSIDVRRTRQLGGHLPSAARSNTTGVLFRNYLAGDQTTIEWAHDVVSEAFADVEQAAYDAHLRALRAMGRRKLSVLATPSSIVADATAEMADSTATETAWASCRDHAHHPATGRRCATSFLDCFHCGNCVVTGSHLPRLLSLLDAFEIRRSQLSDSDWWARYGPAWTAIRRDVLPKFTEAEVALAREHRPADSLLDLVEPRWERP